MQTTPVISFTYLYDEATNCWSIERKKQLRHIAFMIIITIEKLYKLFLVNHNKPPIDS
jgi:hypothetical protein